MGDLQKRDPPSWGRVFLTALKYMALGIGALVMMVLVGGVLLVGFLAYACGHH